MKYYVGSAACGLLRQLDTSTASDLSELEVLLQGTHQLLLPCGIGFMFFNHKRSADYVIEYLTSSSCSLSLACTVDCIPVSCDVDPLPPCPPSVAGDGDGWLGSCSKRFAVENIDGEGLGVVAPAENAAVRASPPLPDNIRGCIHCPPSPIMLYCVLAMLFAL